MDPIIEVKNNRLWYIIPLVLIALLMAVFYWAWVDPTIDLKHSPDTIWKNIPAIIWLVGSVLAIYFLKCFFNPPIVFSADEEGFIYKFNGASTGTIYWDDIKETTDIKIKNNLVTRYTEYYRVIAVYLKEPDAYTEGKNKLSRIMIQSMVNEYGTAIFIRQTALGKSFEEIKILMDDKIAQKKSRFASHHS